MIILALVACLNGAPDQCRDFQFTFVADAATPQQCMMFGQPEIAKWAALHPKWKVRRWKCVVAKGQEREA